MLTDAAGPRELSVAQFKTLPLGERIRHVLQHSVQFDLGTTPVESGPALRSLMEAEPSR